jgi:hypothetical protein
MLENFTWPDPGEDWWTMVGASVGASGPQILFAAARASKYPCREDCRLR